MAAPTSRPEGIIRVASTLNEAFITKEIGVDTVTGQPIVVEIPLGKDDVGFNNQVSIIDNFKIDNQATGRSLYFRGLEGGPGITIEAIDADGVDGTFGSKIVISNTSGAGGGEIITASNIGTGVGIFSKKSGADLQFKSIKESGPIKITSDDVSITIESTAENNTLSSVGTGTSLVSGKVDSDLQIKSISAGQNITITESNSTLIIGATGTLDTASNVGTGAGIFKEKNGVNLVFKTLVAGNNLTLTENENEIVINGQAGGAGEKNYGDNLGTGAEVFKGMNDTILEFRTLTTGNNIELTQNEDNIEIKAINVGEVNTGINLDALAPDRVNVFAGKNGVNLQFRRLEAGGNISLTEDTDKIVISATSGGSGEANTATSVGTMGQSIVVGKTGVDLQFKNIAGATSKVVVTSDANNNVLIDVDEENLSINDMPDDLRINKISADGANNKDVLTVINGDVVWAPAQGGTATSSLPAGGTVGQVLIKNTSTDYDVAWANPPKGDPGEKGDVGPAGVSYKGVFVNGDTYNTRDVVKGSDGNSYYASIDSLTAAPPSTGWVLFLEKGAKGDKGDIGDQGIPGIPGTQGIPGAKGDPGEKGNDGLTTSITLNGTTYTHVNGNIDLGTITGGGGTGTLTSITSTNNLLSVTNSAGPIVSLTVQENNINLANTTGNITNTRVSGLGSMALANSADFASSTHTHTVIGGVNVIKNTLNVTKSTTVPFFIMPANDEMAIIDYYIKEGNNIQAGTITFVAIDSITPVYTDTGTENNAVTAAFTINGKGMNIVAGAVDCVVKYSMRSF